MGGGSICPTHRAGTPTHSSPPDHRLKIGGISTAIHLRQPVERKIEGIFPTILANLGKFISPWEISGNFYPCLAAAACRFPNSGNFTLYFTRFRPQTSIPGNSRNGTAFAGAFLLPLPSRSPSQGELSSFSSFRRTDSYRKALRASVSTMSNRTAPMDSGTP